MEELATLLDFGHSTPKIYCKQTKNEIKKKYPKRKIESIPKIQRLCANVEFNGHLDIGVNS